MACNSSSGGCGCGSAKAQIGYNASRTFSKLTVCDWLKDIPKGAKETDLVEVRFKNTRKEYFSNTNDLPLEVGEIVAVEASPGHDIGMISLTGDLVLKQLEKHNISLKTEFKKIYRKVKSTDLEKWEEIIAIEHSVMIEARQIALDLKLDMKIGDVEFQGDKTKAIFYYIADERVDFRQLIKVLAERFKIRVEMKQIGARQEAGRIGGIASCGRELCCSTWMTNFVSVTTNAARYQELSLNPQKLAGQCGKLKCCLNFELDIYLDAQKDFPNKEIPLRTQTGLFYHQKTDVFKKIMWYSASRESAMNSIPLPLDVVKDIIEQNKRGIEVPELSRDSDEKKKNNQGYTNLVDQESLTRFDEKRKPRRSPRKVKESPDRRFNARNNRNDDVLEKDNFEAVNESVQPKIVVPESQNNDRRIQPSRNNDSRRKNFDRKQSRPNQKPNEVRTIENTQKAPETNSQNAKIEQKNNVPDAKPEQNNANKHKNQERKENQRPSNEAIDPRIEGRSKQRNYRKPPKNRRPNKPE